jgi:hypothetical protein
MVRVDNVESRSLRTASSARVTAPDSTELLRAVLDELRAIRLALAERQRPPLHLTRADRDRLAAILPVIGATLGSEPILTRDVLEDDAPALRLVLKGISARSLGRLLQRAEGAVIGGYTVQRAGVDAGAVVWRVLAVTRGVSN